MSPRLLHLIALALNLAMLVLIMGLYRAVPHQPGPYATKAMEARR